MAGHSVVVNTYNLGSLKDEQSLNTVVCRVWIVGDGSWFRCIILKEERKTHKC